MTCNHEWREYEIVNHVRCDNCKALGLLVHGHGVRLLRCRALECINGAVQVRPIRCQLHTKIPKQETE